MVVEFACAGGVGDALSVPLGGDAPPALFFGFDFHHPGGDDTDARSGGVVDSCCRSIGRGLDTDLRLALLRITDIVWGICVGERDGVCCEGSAGKLVAGDHGGDGHAVAGEVAEGLEPAWAEGLEAGFLEKACVKGVGKIDEILKVLECERGGKGGTAEGLEEFVEGVSPESDDDVVFCGDDAQGGGDGRGEGYLHEIVHHLCEAGGEAIRMRDGVGREVLPFVVGYELDPLLLLELLVGHLASAGVQEHEAVFGVVVCVFCDYF